MKDSLDSYNSTKDSVFSTQTHLRDSHIATSEVGHIGASRGGRRGEGRRWGRSPVLTGSAAVAIAEKGRLEETGQTGGAEAAVQPE